MSITLDLVKDPVTTEQAAIMLSVTRWAVLKAIQKKKIAAEEFGRNWAIEREEVERYRRERKLTGPRKTQPPPP